MPIEAKGYNEIHLARIRRDFSLENRLNLLVVADNIRKAATSNAIQIAEYIIHEGK